MRPCTKALIWIISLMPLISGCISQNEDKSSGFITVDGTKLRYVIEGKGVPCIFIGAAGKNYPGKTFSKQLREHIKFVFMENRAFVLADEPVDIDKITMDTAVDDVELLRKKLGFDKIAVAGHSYPSLLALAYAQKFSENTSHIIMIDITPYLNDNVLKASYEHWQATASDERKNLLKRNYEQLTDEVLSNVPPAWRGYVRSGPMYWYDPTYDCSWLFEDLYTDSKRMDHFLTKHLQHYDFTQGSEITTPVFLALGKYSLVPYYLWDDYRDKLPNLSYHLFEKSSHYPMLEEQKLFDKKLIEWINSH